MTRYQQYFRRTVVCDFEYECPPGGLPTVLCMVAYVLDENLKHIRTARLWRGEFGPRPPFDIGPDTLFVAYSAWAELTCFMTLGWKFPVHVYDLHTAYLSVSNILLPYAPDETRLRQSKDLASACKAYGIAGWENIVKKQMAKDIGEGRWRLYGKQAVFTYCQEDVDKSTTLLRRQLTGYGRFKPINIERVIYWSEYSSKTVSRIQAKGMPIDVWLWNLVQENKAAVVTALLQRFDPSFGHPNAIYSPDGEWSDARFEAWLVRAGIRAWPRLETGKIQIDGDAFGLMHRAHPKIAGLHALRDTLGVIVRANIPIGPDGRNRPSLFPFGTASGRNAQAKSLFNAHASTRSFMLFPRDLIAAYVDWKCQEVAIAAARSGDEQLMHDYGGDIYHALALMCGLTTDTDIKRWKASEIGKIQRQQMKSLQLGVNYGMGVRSLAKGLDRHRLIASEVITLHQRRYPRYWQFKKETAQQAMFDRVMESEYDGWPMHLSTSPNKRTLYNFPMQSGGASMLRLAATRMCEAGLIPNMLVHDGILIEVQTPEQVEEVVEIMRAAGKEVCNGFEVGADVDFDSREKGQRFMDKRPEAVAMWATIMDVLKEIGALPKKGRL